MKAQQWFTHPVGMTVSAVLATLLWGSAMPAIKIGYEELGIASQATHEQWVFAGYRFLLAGFMLMLFAACVNRAARLGNPTIPPKPRRTGWRVARLAVIQTFLQYLCFYIGLSLSTGMKGAIITGATCFFQMVVARLMDGNESFTPGKTLRLVPWIRWRHHRHVESGRNGNVAWYRGRMSDSVRIVWRMGQRAGPP